MANEETENEKSQLTSTIVVEHLQSHDKRMREGREQWALAKACYTTQYWRHVQGSRSTSDSSKLTDVNVEVNRIWGVLTSYLGALYPRANRTVIGPDPAGQGDPAKAELAANRWLSSRKIHHRIMAGLRQSLLYPGCGAKIGFHPGHGNPLDRVWLRVIPWWEMILDHDVGDSEDERFRGHVYFRSKIEVEKEYGLENLAGVSRGDFLDSSAQTDHTRSSAKKRNNTPPSDEGAFVRVLEICNLKDTIKDEKDPSIVYKGRLEIYILGQGRDYDDPVWVGPMPFASTDGQPLPHIIPLIFNHEPEFPLRGISHAARILPQIVELNAYRSFMAMATRKDTRQYITRKGTFGSDELTNLTEGHDGLVMELSNDYDGPLDDAIRPIVNAPLSGNISNYMATVESDLERGIGASPQARGIVTKATAFEVQTVQQYTESDFGMHAALKDEWLAGVIRLVLRAVIASMHDRGDSAGAFDDQEVSLAEVGAIPEEVDAPPEEEEDQLEASGLAEDSGEPSPFVDEDAYDEIGEQEINASLTVVEATPLLLRERNEIISVEMTDLDADFEISFVEGGRTPLSDTTMQQNLVGLMEPYTQLWMAVQEGGPMGTLALSYMKVLAERFDLPRDLHPEELQTKAEQEAGVEPPEQQQQEEQDLAGQMGEPPPQEAAPPGQPEQSMGQILQQIQQMPPEEQIMALKALFQDDPAVLQAIDQLEALPPEQQQEAIQLMLGANNAPV